MALREEWERSGEWLFRWRSYLPIAFVAVVLLVVCQEDHWRRDRQLPVLWDLICLAVSGCGLLVRALVAGYAPRRTSGRSTKHLVAWQLNTTGMYSIVRHPLYLANFLIWLGIVLYAREGWLTAVFTLTYALYYERIMFAEEEFLRRQFGSEFTAWAAQTPAFVPRPWRWKKPSLPFSFRTVLRKEYSALLGIVAGFALLAIGERMAAAQRLEIDLPWAAALAAALFIYGFLRLLKRRTRWLKVAGR